MDSIIPIATNDVVRIGKDPKTTVKFLPEYGFGDDSYVAQLDIFHQLHCLNTLRILAWEAFDRDAMKSKQPYPETHWPHVGQCTAVLRENLMCNANLDVITFNWKDTQHQRYPNFNLNKRCVDAEILMSRQEQNTLPTERSINLRVPKVLSKFPWRISIIECLGLIGRI